MTVDNEFSFNTQRAQALVQALTPDGRMLQWGEFDGDHANYACWIEYEGPTGERQKAVAIRYATFSERAKKLSQLQFRALSWLRENGIPVPEPLLCDVEGGLLGRPGLVTRFVPGKSILPPDEPEDPVAWAQETARMLAQIHAVECDPAARDFLLDGSHEALWFLHEGTMPDYIANHCDGLRVWNAIHECLAQMEVVPQKLVHIDYWQGNLLWEDGRINAVLDWEEASYGEPGKDVAYCLMDFILLGQRAAADEFLRAYLAFSGRVHVPNLRLWQLAAAVRPMHAPEGWIDISPGRERFAEFLAEILG